MAADDWIEVARENKDYFNALIQNIFIDIFNPMLLNLPYDMILAP